MTCGSSPPRTSLPKSRLRRRADPNPGKTEILLLEATLLEVKTLGNQTIATVLFDTMLREVLGLGASQPSRFWAWHFAVAGSGGEKHWVVEGIQQLEK